MDGRGEGWKGRGGGKDGKGREGGLCSSNISLKKLLYFTFDQKESLTLWNAEVIIIIIIRQLIK